MSHIFYIKNGGKIIEIGPGDGALTKKLVNGSSYTLVAADKITIGDVEYTIATNTDLGATFKLSWEWTFDNGTLGNQADTYLGNLAAGLDPDSLAAANYSTDINYYLSLTVEQID